MSIVATTKEESWRKEIGEAMVRKRPKRHGK
jgi:hypothetical protein